MPSDVCAHSVIATDESTRVSSSTTSAYSAVLPPAPPYCSREGNPHQIELAELANDLVGELVVAIQPLRDGRDLGPRELAHGVSQKLLV